MPNFTFVSCDITRKQVRHGTWVHFSKLWNTNWLPSQQNNLLGLYEYDTKSNITLSGTVNLNFGGGTQGVTTTATISTQDEIIRNLSIDRNYFFSRAPFTSGWPVQDGWPVWDAGANVSYTLPYQIIN